LSKHAWAIPKTKKRNEMATAIAKIIRDDGRISEKFVNRYEKRILQRKHAKTPEKT